MLMAYVDPLNIRVDRQKMLKVQKIRSKNTALWEIRKTLTLILTHFQLFSKR